LEEASCKLSGKPGEKYKRQNDSQDLHNVCFCAFGKRHINAERRLEQMFAFGVL
jgi:hypothetical protein